MSGLRAFRRRRGRIERRFRPAERSLLEGLLRDLGERLEAVDSPQADTDPVLDRLLPEAYPDDPLAELEYRTAVRDRAAAAKSEQLERIGADLAASDGLVRLDDAAAVAWLKGIGDLRLALATRYAPETLTGFGHNAAVYGWLSWLQAGLVDAVARD